MFTRLQRRMLVVAGSLALGYAVAFDGIHTRLAPQPSSSGISFQSRGPFSGKLVGDCWYAEQPKSRFIAGEIVVWELRAELHTDTNAVVATELWCNEHLVQFDESKIASAKLQADWVSFGIRIPRDVSGECRLQRHVQTEDDAQAALQDFDLRRPITLTVNPQ